MIKKVKVLFLFPMLMLCGCNETTVVEPTKFRIYCTKYSSECAKHCINHEYFEEQSKYMNIVDIKETYISYGHYHLVITYKQENK